MRRAPSPDAWEAARPERGLPNDGRGKLNKSEDGAKE